MTRSLMCAECVDVHIKQGNDAETPDSAISLFPALSVAQTSAGMVANFVPMPLCYQHRKLMLGNKSSLVTA